MKTLSFYCLIGVMTASAIAQPGIESLTRNGVLTTSNVFLNGVVTIERSESLADEWLPVKNIFSTAAVVSTEVKLDGASGFYRVQTLNLDGGRDGFLNLTRAYGLLTTIAGAGGIQDFNNWRPEFEGALATQVLLSGPHIAMADRAGNIYIADKDAHGIRKVRLDGTIITVAGTSVLGNGTDDEAPGHEVALSGPNGLWVHGDGTVFILDTDNGKVRRLDTNGMMRTLFSVPGGIQVGRGLWVSGDERLVYFCSLTSVRRWTPDEGVVDLATGFIQLGNLVVDPAGNVIVTDRGGHRVYRVDQDGTRTVVAGNGAAQGGGDGALAVDTALEEVRGVWMLPSGALLLCTHRSSRVWYVDTAGYIHLLLNGNRNGAHAGDGTWFYNPAEFRVSECRAITMDYEGNLLITENDVGYIRKVKFLPFQPAANLR